jgi:hypothetical protein
MSYSAEFRDMLENDEFFKRNHKLRKALEALDDEKSKRERLETRLKAEIHLENSRRLLDSLKR